MLCVVATLHWNHLQRFHILGYFGYAESYLCKFQDASFVEFRSYSYSFMSTLWMNVYWCITSKIFQKKKYSNLKMKIIFLDSLELRDTRVYCFFFFFFFFFFFLFFFCCCCCLFFFFVFLFVFLLFFLFCLFVVVFFWFIYLLFIYLFIIIIIIIIIFFFSLV